jgi:hypothetical protein
MRQGTDGRGVGCALMKHGTDNRGVSCARLLGTQTLDTHIMTADVLGMAVRAHIHSCTCSLHGNPHAQGSPHARDSPLAPQTYLCCQLLAPACAEDVECLVCCCGQVGWQAGTEAVALPTQALVVTHLCGWGAGGEGGGQERGGGSAMSDIHVAWWSHTCVVTQQLQSGWAKGLEAGRGSRL